MTDMTLVAILSAVAATGLLLVGIFFAREPQVIKPETHNKIAAVVDPHQSLGHLKYPKANAAMSSAAAENKVASWNSAIPERQSAAVHIGD